MNRKSTLLIAVAACIAILMLPASAFAISRDVVLARGMVWANYVRSVDAKTGKKTTGVLYSQSRWALENGSTISTRTPSASTKGYRTDCSGFASLCWNLRDSSGRPMSLSTADFGAKGSKKYFQIAKEQLQPGDMMLKSTVWGASGGHAIIFAGWVDGSMTQYWALEQTTSSAHNGTIYHTRTYGEAYYRPYRYSGLEDMFSDVEETVSGADAYRAAAAASLAAHPVGKTVNTLVIANGSILGDQVTAASIAGGARGPVLLVGTKSLPASTTAEIKRLKPKFIYLLGSTANISPAVQSAITTLCPTVARINGKNSFEVAANSVSTTLMLAKRTGHALDTVYVASGDESAEALSAAPLLARLSRPVLYVHQGSVPAIAMKKLKATTVRKVVILGGTSAVGTAVETAFKKAGYKVSRVGGTDCYKTSVAIAAHALALKVGFVWKRVGVASPGLCTDALAWAATNGAAGSMLLLTPRKSLDSGVKSAVVAHRTEIGKARVFGGCGAVDAAARKTLAIALRSGK